MAQNPMKNQASARPNTQAGSIFVWIFVMIALFGALSFALTESFRGGGAAISKDKAKLAASELLDYANSVAQAVKMLQINNCTEKQLGFDNSDWAKYNGTLLNGPNHNPSSRADCKVFSPGGGGLQTTVFPDNGVPPGLNMIRSGNISFSRLHIDGVGDTDEEDLVLWAGYVDKNICAQINALLGVDNPGGEAPATLPTSEALPYNGVFDNTSGHIGVSGPLYGKRAFCYRWTSGTPHPHDPYDYHYIQVLLAR
jgi:hypothetical protein